MDVSLQDRLKRLRLLATDFDGVMTDGYVFVDEGGREWVRCSRKDGLGIGLLRREGVEVIVLSKETNPVVAARCRKLRIPCFHGIEDGQGKLEKLQEIALQKGFSPEEIGFIGDDVNDCEALKYAGVSMTVSDAHPSVLSLCCYVTRACGGAHAVREIAEMILAAKGRAVGGP
jgi:YrbI family 3-deoxy-D-manno-octulosonate 8-phosphate phosphatase